MIFIHFLILITPIFDVFLSANDLVFPLNIFRFTTVVLAFAAAYDSKKFFVSIFISALFFSILSYPDDLAAFFIVMITPILFMFKQHFRFLSEQWIRPAILMLGFILSYLIWIANNVSWSVIDYKYFGAAFCIQVIMSIVISVILLKISDLFVSPHTRYEIPKNRI